MKQLFLFLTLTAHFTSFPQQLQLHYDARHTLAPKQATRNFCTFYFEYFNSKDSGNGRIIPGSFLFKAQADLNGDKSNIGKFYMQVSQSFRCWKPRIFVQLQYSGGMGIAEPGAYGFYINNAFSIGLGHPFQWKKTWMNIYACYTINTFKKTSHDMLASFYWWKGFMNYRLQFSGDFNVYTLNRNHGDPFTAGMHGKKFSFFGEPQLWYRLKGGLYGGTRFNLYYHVLTDNNIFQIYLTIGLRYQFR